MRSENHGREAEKVPTTIEERDQFVPVRLLGAKESALSNGRFTKETIDALVGVAEITEGSRHELVLNVLSAAPERELNEEEQAFLDGIREFPGDPELSLYAAEEAFGELTEGFARASLRAAREFPKNSKAAYLAETQILSVYYDDVVLTIEDMALLSGYREFPELAEAPIAELAAKEILGTISAEEAEELRVKRGGLLH